MGEGYDHDYCKQNGCPVVVERNVNNLFDQSIPRISGVIDKWTCRLLTDVDEKDDWNRIVDRETAILKIRYPYLPEQQIRGKAYKKFGIPAVMGGLLSCASKISNRVIPKITSNPRKKTDATMSQSPAVVKLELLSELQSDEKNRLQNLLLGSLKREIIINNEDSPDNKNIGSTVVSKESLASSNETESPTPDFDYSTSLVHSSIHSKSTQIEDSQFSNYSNSMEINSIPTQLITPYLKYVGNDGIVTDGDETTDCSSEVEVRDTMPISYLVKSVVCSQIVSPAELPTQLDCEDGIFHVDLNDNFVQTDARTLRRKDNLNSIAISPPNKSNYLRKIESKRRPSMMIGNSPEIDDFSNLSTPKSCPFTDDFYSHTNYRKIVEFSTQKDSQRTNTSDVIVKTECDFSQEVRKKRNPNNRETTDNEDKENFPHEKDFEIASKLRRLDETTSLIKSARKLNLNESPMVNEINLSPVISTPPIKKRRLNSYDDRSSCATIEMSEILMADNGENLSDISTLKLTKDDKYVAMVCDDETPTEFSCKNCSNVTDRRSVPIAVEFLSNRCCEYDCNFSDENFSFHEIRDDSNCLSGLKKSFEVDVVVIRRQVDQILTFLNNEVDDD